ncbi:hypothetical protein C0992_004970 [Termitomyces sp. T32_za158]|nr:hypothetical protein C0992_004970 [Termitomyces sp. T32_za158]
MSFQGQAPFVIAISDEHLSLLSKKLALATLPDEIDGASWDYGVPLADIKRLVHHWKNGFDWRKQEAALNAELPQFTRDIDVEGYGTLNIHYVHKKSEVTGAIPLLFVHGWPGSFIEVRKLLPLLIEASPDHPSFHVVAISLPGYGFSSAPSKKGFEITQYAEVAHKLMLVLGYDEYVTQGGDWGYMITRKISELYGPKYSKAWHTNCPVSGPPTTSRPLVWLRYALSGFPLLSYNKREKTGLERSAWFQRQGFGYFAEQSTRPQTLGYGLADSPVGLLAWIYEKLVEWTDGYKWNDDEVLTWISIYLFSRAGATASIRIYYESLKVANASGKDLFSLAMHNKVPVGWTHVPNLVFEAEHEEGGHFAAYEKPEILAGDLRKMFGKGGGAFGVVKDKNGYDA